MEGNDRKIENSELQIEKSRDRYFSQLSNIEKIDILQKYRADKLEIYRNQSVFGTYGYLLIQWFLVFAGVYVYAKSTCGSLRSLWESNFGLIHTVVFLFCCWIVVQVIQFFLNRQFNKLESRDFRNRFKHFSEFLEYNYYDEPF